MKRFIASQLVSSVGDGVSQAAGPLLLVAVTTDPMTVTALAVAQSAPWLLFAMPAGLLVDRVDKRRLLIACQLIRFVGTAPLAVAIVLGNRDPILLYAVAFLVSTVETVADSAAGALLPDLVDRSELVRANGWLNGGQNVCHTFVGPPVAAVTFLVSPALPFLIDTATYLVSGLMLLAVRVRRPVATTTPATGDEPARLPRAMVEGLVQISRSRILGTLYLALAALSAAYGAVLSVLALYTHTRLHVPDSAYSLLLVAIGAATVAAAGVSNRMVRGWGSYRAVLASVLALAVGLVAMGVARHLAVAAIGALVVGLGTGAWNTVTTALRQAAAPPAELGRILSAGRLIGWGLATIGPLLAGLVATRLGLDAVMYLAAAVMVGTVAFLAAGLGPVRVPLDELDRQLSTSSARRTDTAANRHQ